MTYQGGMEAQPGFKLLVVRSSNGSLPEVVAGRRRGPCYCSGGTVTSSQLLQVLSGRKWGLLAGS